MLQGWCLYIFWKAVHSLFADNIEGCAMNVVAKTPLVSPQINENSGKLPARIHADIGPRLFSG